MCYFYCATCKQSMKGLLISSLFSYHVGKLTQGFECDVCLNVTFVSSNLPESQRVRRKRGQAA